MTVELKAEKDVSTNNKAINNNQKCTNPESTNLDNCRMLCISWVTEFVEWQVMKINDFLELYFLL